MSRMLGAVPADDAAMSNTTSSSASFSLKMRTALTGSPTYFSSEKRTVLTKPPSRSSRQGVIRGRSISELGEVLQEPGSEVMALLGMELDAGHVPGTHGTGEVTPVARHGQDIGRARALEIERVQEIEARIGVEAREERRHRLRPRIVPPHVRHRPGGL